MVGTGELREVGRACACANLRRASRVVTQLYDAALAPSGLRCTQFTLLATSRLMGEAKLNELAGQMEMDRTTLSRNLGPLVREGLADVVPGEDSRTRLIRVTSAGESALDEAYPMWQTAQEQVVEALGRERFEVLLGGLGQTVALSTALPNPRPESEQDS